MAANKIGGLVTHICRDGVAHLFEFRAPIGVFIRCTGNERHSAPNRAAHIRDTRQPRGCAPSLRARDSGRPVMKNTATPKSLAERKTSSVGSMAGSRPSWSQDAHPQGAPVPIWQGPEMVVELDDLPIGKRGLVDIEHQSGVGDLARLRG